MGQRQIMTDTHGASAAHLDVSFLAVFRTFAKVGVLSFGGPAAQIALMHRLVVEDKKWLGEAQFLHALNFCMLLPGPEAQQLATYIGWLLHGVRGGLVAGLLFILPGALVMLGLSIAYVTLGSHPVADGILFGLKAAVLVIVAQALLRIASRALHGPAAWVLAAGAFVALYVFDLPFPVVVITAALIGYGAGRLGWRAFASSGHGPADGPPPIGQRRQSPAAYLLTLVSSALVWLTPVAVLAAQGGVLGDIAVFFAKLAVITFGGAYAVLAWVADVAVGTYGWLEPREMIDALGLAETTPGPLILVTQFVGFLAAYRDGGTLVAGLLGALTTTWVTFAPCFLWIFAGAPYVERLRAHAALSSALAAITAAVVGVVANLALWFAVHFLFADAARLPDPASLDRVAALLTGALGFVAWRMQVAVPVLLVMGIVGGMVAALAAAAV
jgi:chromate transporter